MSGYTVAGVPFLTSPSSGRQPTHGRQPDIRRNLYVLGLPFDLPKSEFTSLFSRYGTVAHSVILATVDNASRRRGFVVMSSNIEARSAMTGLTRTEIKGHTIDVSWAVVQRSQGFLDGGDRAMVLASRSSSQDSSSDCSDCDSYFLPSRPSTALSGSFSSTIILIKNLPSLLFSQTVDLHPLVCPFGELKKLGIMEPNLTEPRDGRNTLSALVEFVSSVSAQEAVKSLRGQMYAGFEVMADFADMEPTPGSPPWSSSQELPHPQTVEPAPYPTRYGVENQGGKLSLNPHAPPFVLQFPSNEAKFFSSAISHTPNAFLGARTTYPRGPLGPSLYHNLPRPQTAIPPTFFKPKSAALSHYGSDVRFSPMHSFE
ncbi:hypothetical protein JAAARDRAFT_128891 [Jaapia argillacea MUCL 33604]|uniref:RRM domain-containing protein n=1 Tax=Jaapia argillacea MUCL 33604 TaxID=933084 RepID=A0A067PV00_9AGAM|nr:hypothetical protein JAAARDRAFT_128891 [Jaapia argillacea MUCL 33604]